MIIFNHIPKTGGISIYRVIERLLGQDRITPHLSLHEDVAYPFEADDFTRCRVIYGHIGTAWNDVLGPGRKWMTILRNPVDRVLSQYYYWRYAISPRPHLFDVHAAQTPPLEEYLRLRDEKFPQSNANMQTWLVADDFRVRYRKVAPHDALEIAKGHLVERCAFVGIFEDFRGSGERLCRLFGSPMLDGVPAENRTPDRKSAEEINSSLVETIRELNPLDHALYEFARKLYKDNESSVKQSSAPQAHPGRGNPPPPSRGPDPQTCR